MQKTYSEQSLQDVLDAYGVGRMVTSHLFTSGSENSNFYIETASGRYVLKIFDGVGMLPQSVRFEVGVMAHCHTEGAQTPKVYQNMDGSLVTEKNGLLCAVYDFLEGENDDTASFSDNVIAQIGSESGKIDRLLGVFQDPSATRQNYSFDTKNFLTTRVRLASLPKECDRSLVEEVYTRFEALKPVFDTLPTGLMHNDIIPRNVLVKDDVLIGIIDFSDMAFSPYIGGIANSLVDTCFLYNWNPAQAKIFLTAYGRKRALRPQELPILYDVMLTRYVVTLVEMYHWNMEFGSDPKRTKWADAHYQYLCKFLEFGKKRFDAVIS